METLNVINRRIYKKVLLRERKRHAARRVVSTSSVVLTGYPHCPDLAGGTLLGGGYPTWVSPVLAWRDTLSGGYPARGYPIWEPPWPDLTLAGIPSRVPPHCQQGTPHPDLAGGTLLGGTLPGYPHGVCPMAFWVMLQSIMRYGYPPPPVSAPWHSG